MSFQFEKFCLMLLCILHFFNVSLPFPHASLSDPRGNFSLQVPLLDVDSDVPYLEPSTGSAQANSSSAPSDEPMCTAAMRAQQQQQLDPCFREMVTSVVFEVMQGAVQHFSPVPSNASDEERTEADRGARDSPQDPPPEVLVPEKVTAPVSPRVLLFQNGSTTGRLAIERTSLFLGFEFVGPTARLMSSSNESEAPSDVQRAEIRVWLMGASHPSCLGETSFEVELELPAAASSAQADNVTSNQTYRMSELSQWMLTARALDWALSSNCTELAALSKDGGHFGSVPDHQTDQPTLTGAPTTTTAWHPRETTLLPNQKDATTIATPAGELSDRVSDWLKRLQELFVFVDQCQRSPSCFCSRISGRRVRSSGDARPSSTSSNSPTARPNAANETRTSTADQETEGAGVEEGMMSGDKGDRAAPMARRDDTLDDSTSTEYDEAVQCTVLL